MTTPLRLVAFAAIVLTFLSLSNQLSASIVIQDDFSGYTAGTSLNPGNGWSAKWDGNNTSQQNLYSVDSNGVLNLDTSTAWANYHALNSTPVQLATGKTITISTDFQYTHEAGGNITTNLNQNVFGLMASTTQNWWNGTNAVVSMSNRGGALGLKVPVDPWIEGWMTHNSLGVNTTTGGTSNWLTLEYILHDDGTNVTASVNVLNNGVSQFPTTSYTTAIASGSTIYTGFSTNWNDFGQNSVSSWSKISGVNFDNFTVTSVPEPSSLMLIAFGIAGASMSRRRR